MAMILPDDLIVLILQKTNFRCLLRCTSVCKRWLVLASDEFASRDCPFPLPPGLITQTYYGKSPYRTKLISLNGGGPHRIPLRISGVADADLQIAASGNGLLFLVQDLPDGRIGDDCYLYNPNTWEYAVVPRPTRCQINVYDLFRRQHDDALKIGLAFGLPVHGGAVIVSVFPIRTADGYRSEFGFEIYTLESRVWRVSAAKSGMVRNISAAGRALVCNANAGAVFYKSMLYWCFWDTDILEFDPVAEKARWIHGACQPPYDDGLDPGLAECYLWFGEYKGALTVISINTISLLLHAYVMVKDSPFLWSLWLPGMVDLNRNTNFQQLTPQLGCKGGYDGYVFHLLGLLTQAGSGHDVVVLSTLCQKLLALDIQTKGLQIIIDDMKDVDHICCALEQLSVVYSPTTKSLDRWNRKSEVVELIGHEADEEYDCWRCSSR